MADWFTIRNMQQTEIERWPYHVAVDLALLFPSDYDNS
jgi:hypothetical protein